MTKTSTFSSWSSMLFRCNNPSATGYRYYGGRGISVCPEWSSFDAFYADMGERPSTKYSIDRIDTNGNYCPENCRWATHKEQARNRRTNTLITINGETLCIADWAIRYNIGDATIRARIRAGWPADKAVTYPARAYKHYPA